MTQCLGMRGKIPERREGQRSESLGRSRLIPLQSLLHKSKARLVSARSKGPRGGCGAEDLILGANANRDLTSLSFCTRIVLVFVSVLVKELHILNNLLLTILFLQGLLFSMHRIFRNAYIML